MGPSCFACSRLDPNGISVTMASSTCHLGAPHSRHARPPRPAPATRIWSMRPVLHRRPAAGCAATAGQARLAQPPQPPALHAARAGPRRPRRRRRHRRVPQPADPRRLPLPARPAAAAARAGRARARPPGGRRSVPDGVAGGRGRSAPRHPGGRVLPLGPDRPAARALRRGRRAGRRPLPARALSALRRRAGSEPRGRRAARRRGHRTSARPAARRRRRDLSPRAARRGPARAARARPRCAPPRLRRPARAGEERRRARRGRGARWARPITCCSSAAASRPGRRRARDAAPLPGRERGRRRPARRVRCARARRPAGDLRARRARGDGLRPAGGRLRRRRARRDRRRFGGPPRARRRRSAALAAAVAEVFARGPARLGAAARARVLDGYTWEATLCRRSCVTTSGCCAAGSCSPIRPRSSRPEARVALEYAVSVHDVAPATWADCERLLALTDRLGAPATLLVVPHYHDGIRADRDPRFAAALRRRVAHGDEVVLHGYWHEDRAARGHSPLDWLRRRVLTASEGEFAAVESGPRRC